jgi:hypothetical protein
MLSDPIRSIWVRASPRRLLTFSGARYLLAELLEVKGTQDWGEAMNYDPVRNVHAVDIMKPAGRAPEISLGRRSSAASTMDTGKCAGTWTHCHLLHMARRRRACRHRDTSYAERSATTWQCF